MGAVRQPQKPFQLTEKVRGEAGNINERMANKQKEDLTYTPIHKKAYVDRHSTIQVSRRLFEELMEISPISPQNRFEDVNIHQEEFLANESEID